jgi:hypothetical protein
LIPYVLVHEERLELSRCYPLEPKSDMRLQKAAIAGFLIDEEVGRSTKKQVGPGG